mgnify:CR=1 FL=1
MDSFGGTAEVEFLSNRDEVAKMSSSIIQTLPRSLCIALFRAKTRHEQLHS